MKIKKDFLRIAHGVRNAAGEKGEPEQQPIQRVLTFDAPASLQHAGPVGSIPAQVIYETTAGEFAQGLRGRCGHCKNFDKEAFRKYRAACESSSSMTKRAEINALRALYATTHNEAVINRSTAAAGPGSDGDMDVEHALTFIGICHPLTEMHRDAVLVDETFGCCPDEVCSPDRPQGLFVPLDRAAERAGSADFDAVMNQAVGPR